MWMPTSGHAARGEYIPVTAAVAVGAILPRYGSAGWFSATAAAPTTTWPEPAASAWPSAAWSIAEADWAVPADRADSPVTTTAATAAPATNRRQWRDHPWTMSAPIHAIDFRRTQNLGRRALGRQGERAG